MQNFWTWSVSRKDSYSIILWVFQTPLPVKCSGILIFLTFIECSHIMLSPFEQFYSGYYVIKQASQQAMQMLLILQGLLQMQKNLCLCLALYISRYASFDVLADQFQYPGHGCTWNSIELWHSMSISHGNDFILIIKQAYNVKMLSRGCEFYNYVEVCIWMSVGIRNVLFLHGGVLTNSGWREAWKELQVFSLCTTPNAFDGHLSALF